MDTKALLQRIGIDRYDGPPRLEALSQLHAAYVDQVPYETVQYQLTPGGPLDPEEVAKRIVARETGGYCFQLNGTLALLLTELGYRVQMHRGGVQTVNRPGDIDGSHLVLTVSGLVEDPERQWLVDAGLGDGLRYPMPLEAGEMEQYPFTLRLRPSEKTDGWRLDHDPRASLIGMDFESAAVTLDAFGNQHAALSADPASPFVRLASAFRRTPESVVVLRSVGLTETFSDHVDNTLLENPTDYFAALADVFHLPLPHYTQADRDTLWRRVWSQYEDFQTRATSS
ncbi:arylamine N-acetyltransferase family protein [Kribbella speibonae]|uniref:Arylamine N-acetyltransferase n=1 Tax=Kribbella speibonae TaxID=1572660 RepID=A0A4R0JAF3_9ACTN|nr:arylamine N-acetyltransferase [Kribbella speibonae]TCC20080.1 arylamine N-acetyltransferase [Kribbella speibonae]TCC41348.1 arylamine N-acetyltransferase [Kribbella speibonae]